MKIVNKRARFDYHVLDQYEAGINLSGPEVKSVKLGRIILEQAYVKIIGSETYLVGANIPPYPFAKVEKYDPKRTRKLLLHKREIIALKTKTIQFGLTIVPLSCYTKHGLVKLEIGLAKGKKKYDKRKEIQKREQEREIKRILRGKNR